MNTEFILEQCITQAMQLKNNIINHGSVPYKYLGGEMKPMYERVRTYQTELVDKILRELKEHSEKY